jgi:putative nucleotidyltransferase with HDIG domain
LEQAFTTTLTVLCSAVEANDAYTAAHEQDVAALAAAVAAELELPISEQRAVQYAALTHDVGKIAVPSQILNKRGPLDAGEWQIMRGHAAIGSELLRQIPFFAAVHPMVRSHHERWDGGGYPDGLAGEQIPLESRIILVADAFEAITADRPYRMHRSADAAMVELERNAGTQFDRDCVAALGRVVRPQLRQAA